MQPQLRQMPPRCSRSTTAVLNPTCAARMAATYPPGPPPMTMMSYESAIRLLRSRGKFKERRCLADQHRRQSRCEPSNFVAVLRHVEIGARNLDGSTVLFGEERVAYRTDRIGMN